MGIAVLGIGHIGQTVVRALNAMNAYLMVEPKQLAGGDHTALDSGNDSGARTEEIQLLESLGWSQVVDLGDIATARGTEMYSPLWLRIMRPLQRPMFNIEVVR